MFNQLLNVLFSNLSFLLPIQRLRETATLVAFHHPQPSYPFHVLLVPKRPYATLLDVPPDAGDFMRDLFETAQSLVKEYHLDEGGYRLIANGGTFQDLPHLHFHLIAENIPHPSPPPPQWQDKIFKVIKALLP